MKQDQNNLVANDNSTDLKVNNYWKDSGVDQSQMDSKPCAMIYNNDDAWSMMDEYCYPIITKPGESKMEAYFNVKYPMCNDNDNDKD